MKKGIVTKPFDRYRVPPKQNIVLTPLIWLACWFMTRSGRLKITKKRMNGLKPPFLVLGSHHSFADFYITPLALFPYRANYVSELEGFENFGEELYRQAGCLGTRKFVSDLALVKNIKKVMERKGILVLYPEARYANVGTSSELPDSTGKLAKMLKVPVVVINMHGNYLQSPIWNLTRRKGARLETTIEQLFTVEELADASVDEVNKKISQSLTYDEYTWQLDKQMEIDYPKRAEGLELVLYQCPVCQNEFELYTKDAAIGCQHCNSSWQMTELGQLSSSIDSELYPDAVDFTHIPDWYEWERLQVHKKIEAGTYELAVEVQIEALPNAVNFIDLGTGRLLHNQDGFFLTFTEYGDQEVKTLHFPPQSMFSIHTEYDYRGKGQCVTLSTLDNTYFLFPLAEEKSFNATKIQFATEYLHKKAKQMI